MFYNAKRERGDIKNINVFCAHNIFLWIPLYLWQPDIVTLAKNMQ